MDRLLDEARTGPQFLRMPEVASLVIEAIYCAERVLSLYELHSYVVMPNHVHLLITPNHDVPRLLRPLKGITARKANEVLHRSGQRFWQEESYDHWVRNGEEFEIIKKYIELNPVRACLASTADEYQWSSSGAVRQNREPVVRPAS